MATITAINATTAMRRFPAAVAVAPPSSSSEVELSEAGVAVAPAAAAIFASLTTVVASAASLLEHLKCSEVLTICSSVYPIAQDA